LISILKLELNPEICPPPIRDYLSSLKSITITPLPAIQQSEKLFLGGTIYSLKDATFEVVPRTHYAQVLLSSTMIADHFPHVYTQSLSGILNPPKEDLTWAHGKEIAKKVLGGLVIGFLLYELRKRWK
jgi:hypothetical protein